MKKQLAKLALTATLALAITLSFTACEEKKKQDGADTTATEPAAAAVEKPAENAGGGDTQGGCPNAVTGNGTLSCGGQTYKTVKIGKQVWMAENLNYETKEGSMRHSEDGWNEYGRLYDWETALKVCPKGWHLPSNEEWQTLVNFAGGKEIAGKKLKAKEGWTSYRECMEYEDECDGDCGCVEFGKEESGNGTDDYGFQALPGGWCCGDTGYGDVSWSYYGYWWSSSKNGSSGAYASILYNWRMGYRSDDIDVSDYKQGDWYSVRCIQD